VLGKTLEVFAGEKTDSETLESIKTAFEKIEAFGSDIVFYHADDSPYWVSLKLSPVADRSGFLSHWVILGRPRSEEAHAEKHGRHAASGNGSAKSMVKNVKELKKALSQADQRLRLLQGGVQDQANMIETLCESNKELISKLQSILEEDI
jgi:hypothetical protein